MFATGVYVNVSSSTTGTARNSHGVERESRRRCSACGGPGLRGAGEPACRRIVSAAGVAAPASLPVPVPAPVPVSGTVSKACVRSVISPRLSTPVKSIPGRTAPGAGHWHRGRPAESGSGTADRRDGRGPLLVQIGEVAVQTAAGGAACDVHDVLPVVGLVQSDLRLVVDLRDQRVLLLAELNELHA